MSVEEILKYAFEKFDENDYDGAVKAFMVAHHASSDEQQREDIYGVIKENFIMPNSEEFKENYYKNVEFLSSNNALRLDKTPDFNELPCEMVPVSDDRFYVWDEGNKNFWGGEAFDISSIEISATKEFDSIIIDGFSDMRLIVAEISNKLYANVYIVITDEKMMNKLFSFLTLSDIAEMFLKNVYLFDDREKLKSYLYETGKYIPKTIKSFENYDYAEMMSEIHEKRIREKKKNRPFLSIVIPSFNRGDILLRNVKRLQSLMYDEEIEFCICNNSSTETCEKYDEIAKISESDSRVEYFVRPSKVFRDSFENVMKIPNGKYAVFCSDEDFIISENLMVALNVIYNHGDVGVSCFGVIVNETMAYYLTNKERTIPAGIIGVKTGFGCNYMSGLCVSVDSIRKSNIVDRISGLYKKNNEYYKCYPHCVYMAYLANQAGLYLANIPLFFDSTKEDNQKNISSSNEVPDHILVESRISQAHDQIKIALDMKLPEISVVEVVFHIFTRIFDLLHVAYNIYPEGMEKKHSWKETCEIVNSFAEAEMQGLTDGFVNDLNLIDILRANFEEVYQNEINRK